jgi:hypothetical protein
MPPHLSGSDSLFASSFDRMVFYSAMSRALRGFGGDSQQIFHLSADQAHVHHYATQSRLGRSRLGLQNFRWGETPHPGMISVQLQSNSKAG